ncbi:NUC156 domain protein [Trichuris suis]|nr:NUC156 domain protein [Trichuris suis]
MYFETGSIPIRSCDVEDVLSQFGIRDSASQVTALSFHVGAVLLVRPAVAKELPFEQSEVVEMFYGSEEVLKNGTPIVPSAVIPNTKCEDLLFYPSSDMKLVSSSILQECVQLGLQKLFVVLACGAAGVGKSTLLRFIVNGLLSIGVEPFLMDLDTGQSEFCLPGCLAVKKMRFPLIGPPFGRFMNDPDLCYFFGEASPAGRPQVYLQLISELFRQYTDKISSGILLVNTNGYVVGLGAEILMEIVKVLKPDRVLVLSNVIECRDDDNPTELRKLLEPLVNVKLLRTSHCKLGTKGTLNNARLRDVQIASYMFRDSSCLKQLYSKKPFVVSWNKLYVADTSQKIQREFLMYGLNGCLVALCHVPANIAQGSAPRFYFGDRSWPMVLPSNCTPCFIGFALVRSIDVSRKCFYLVSPLSLLEIQNANCILFGDVQIPRDLYVAQTSFLGPSSIPKVEVKRPARFPIPLGRLKEQMWRINTFRSRNFRITEAAIVQRKIRRIKAHQSVEKGAM